MCERLVDHFLGNIGALRCPVGEAAPKAVHGELLAAERVHDRQERHVGERLLAERGQDLASVAMPERPAPLQDLDRGWRERHDMRLAHLHPSGRDRPERVLQIELWPGRMPHLA